MTPGSPETPHELSFGHELPPEDSAAPSKGTIRVLQLYPRDMNIYGDWATPWSSRSACAGTATRRNCSSTTLVTRSLRTWT